MNQVVETILTRRSCKKYSPKTVPAQLLSQIITAGTYAPSAHGKQSGKIVVITDPAEISSLEARNAEFLGKRGAHTFYGAPVVLVVLADAQAPTCIEDGALIIGNMLIAAHSLGLGACWINRAREEFDSPEGKVRLRKWGIEGEYRGVGFCVIGYRDGELKKAEPRKKDYVVYPVKEA